MAKKKTTKAAAKPQAKFGIIGMAVMGQNLALNVESKGFPCAVFNRTGSRTKEFVEAKCQGKKVIPSYTLKDFVASIRRPRKIMLMVKAGEAVDAFIKKLLPLLEKGDLIEQGTHEELAAKEDGVYAKLLRMQSEAQSLIALGG